jgi:hypothetical protein
MVEKNKNPEAQFFVMVPRVGGMVPHQSILVSQTKAMVDPSTGVQLCDETTDELVPDGRGLIRLDVNHPNHKARVKVLSMKMERENLAGRAPVLIGPFDDEVEAFAKMHDVRPKTADEAVAISNAKLKSTEAENASLREIIKELEQSKGKKA